jgi:hypothetical protein
MIKAFQNPALLFINFLFIFSSYLPAQNKNELEPYLKTLSDKGEDPVKFVLNKFDNYDLLIFDDALHSAYEPFMFYQKLIKEPDFKKRVKYIFLEVISINKQPCIDSYMKSSPENQSLLYSAFQDDFSGYGWAYQTYFDLLHTIYTVNQNLADSEKIKVLAVNNPVYWSEIKTPEDVGLFRQSLIGNDYSMYMIILNYMANFKENRKGIFLTNTRHAYKGIKDKQNNLYWDCGTFFHQWHPGKTYSIRVHNVNLYIESKKEVSPLQVKTTAGTENYNLKWVRIEKGKWDYVFREYGNKPVAFDLKDTPFGNTPYIGNHMLYAAAGQTIYDAYDALVFLAPIDSLHMTALTKKIYTDKFKKELERRYKVLETPLQINEMINRSGCSNISEYINKNFKDEPVKISPISKIIGSIDEWEEGKQ